MWREEWGGGEVKKKRDGEKGSEVCATREPVKQQQNGERGGELCVSGCTPYYQV